jgi:NTP pyrophosphatase (non-canonical NTP hydrolase)
VPSNRGDDLGDGVLLNKLAAEIADTFIYLDLLATYYGIDLEQAVIDKFNEVSEREGFPEMIR